MLQNLKHLYGRHLDALDGEIGQVKDFIFDDVTWKIRHVLAATDNWLNTPQVRLPPESFSAPLIGGARQGGDSARVKLTRAQIESGLAIGPPEPIPSGDKPAIQTGAPPDFWAGDGAWSGATGALHEVAASEDRPLTTAEPRQNSHLQSTISLMGCRVFATDGPLGTVVGFIGDGGAWAIGQMVVEAGPWYARETILLRREQVARISPAEATVWLNVRAGECRPPTDAGTARTRTNNDVH